MGVSNRMAAIDDILYRIFAITPDDDATLDRVLDMLNENQREKLLAILVASSSIDFGSTPTSLDPDDGGIPPTAIQSFKRLPYAEFSDVLQRLQVNLLTSMSAGITSLSQRLDSVEQVLKSRAPGSGFGGQQQFQELSTYAHQFKLP